MMVQRMIVLAGPPLDYNDNTRLKSGEGEEKREGQREPYQQLICKSVALHKTVFVIRFELILQSAGKKALAVSVSVHSRNYEIHGPPVKQSLKKNGWMDGKLVFSWRQKSSDRFNPADLPPPLPAVTKTDKPRQLESNTTFLSIYDCRAHVRLSVSLKHQHCNAASEMRCDVIALSIITACIIDHSIMAELEIKKKLC